MSAFDENDDETDGIDWSGAEKAARVGQHEEPTMGSALERARERGGRDVFGVVGALEDKKPNRFERAVAELTPPEEKPQGSARPYGPVEPPPPEPPPEPDVAPPPEAPPDFKGFPVQTSAAPDPARQARLSALERVQKLIDAPRMAPPSGLDDGAIAAAQQRDAQSNRADNITQALQAWMLRQPYKPIASHEGQDLLQRRQLAESSAEKDRQQQLSGAEALAKTPDDGPKPIDPSLAALHEASALQLRSLAARGDTEEQRKVDEQKRVHSEEDASLPGEKAAMLADPRAKAIGLTPAMVEKLDRKGLAELRARLDSYHAPKPAKTGAGGPGGKMLPADQVAQLGDYDTATKSVDDLLRTHHDKNMSGGGARAANMLPQSGPFSTPLGLGSDTAEYNDKAKATAQVVGYILEGGKLSDADVPRYLKMLPGPGDSPERAAEKTANIHRLLQEKKAGRLKTFGDAGYRVPGGGGSSGGGTVKMRFPDGSEHDVPQEKLEKARQKGGVEVSGG